MKVKFIEAKYAAIKASSASTAATSSSTPQAQRTGYVLCLQSDRKGAWVRRWLVLDNENLHIYKNDVRVSQCTCSFTHLNLIDLNLVDLNLVDWLCLCDTEKRHGTPFDSTDHQWCQGIGQERVWLRYGHTNSHLQFPCCVECRA
jgi:hypothetical protein